MGVTELRKRRAFIKEFKARGFFGTSGEILLELSLDVRVRRVCDGGSSSAIGGDANGGMAGLLPPLPTRYRKASSL